ncbi:MAG TPA: hypothetical protein VLM79_12795 [Kofleriaceae bacterium]|nr:hypothetical protein [Kofleriaceae bacterium]
MSAPSDPRVNDRLDAMLAPLRDRPAELDELTQARVRGRLDAAIADDVSPAENGNGRAWRIAGISVAVAIGAAAVGAVVVSMTSAKPPPVTRSIAAGAATPSDVVIARSPTGSGAVAGSATETRATGSEAMASSTTGGATAPIAVAAGQSVQVMVGGAAVTVYGPGQLSPMPDGALADGTGVVVDRIEGDRPWSMRYHGATVVAMHATFALDLGNGPRVTVVRGEISLLCSSGARTIRAGGSGTCPVEEVRAAPPARVAVPSTQRPRAPRSPALPELRTKADGAMAADAIGHYAAAEAALRRGDVEGARRALLAVIAAAPGSLDAATALLDLARLAASLAETASALEYLERLDRHPRGAALGAAAAHLRATLPPRP